MKCEHCGAEWTIGKKQMVVSHCPFCGEALVQERQTENVLSMETALRVIIGIYGTGIISDQRKFISVFKDVAPKLKDEQKILNFSLSLGISDYFADCPVKERKDNIIKARYALDCLNSEIREMVIASFIKALGWDKENQEILTNDDQHAITDKPLQDNKKGNFTETIKKKVLVHTDKKPQITNNDEENTLIDSKSAFDTYDMACRYEYGMGVEKSIEKAISLFKEAAAQGNSEAKNKLGDLYYYGKGVEQNYDEAVKWYGKAAEQGDAKGYENFCNAHKYK